MIDFQPAEMLVLQARQRFEEDHRRTVAIAVEQGEAALGLIFEQAADQRHDGRDPRPAGDADQMPLLLGVEIGSERPVRRHDVDRVAGLQLIADPVGKQPAADALDGHQPVIVVGRGAQRIIAPHFLAIERRAERQMLPRPERELVAQLGRNFEADRIRLVRLRHDLRDPKRVEMLGHPTRSRRGRYAAGTASPPANGRDVRCDGRAGRRGSGAGPRAARASRRRAPRRSPSDIPPRTARGSGAMPASIAACSASSTSNSSGTKRQHQSSPSAMRRALSSVPSPRRIVHSDASSR